MHTYLVSYLVGLQEIANQSSPAPPHVASVGDLCRFHGVGQSFKVVGRVQTITPHMTTIEVLLERFYS
jgi:hypothetical protein